MKKQKVVRTYCNGCNIGVSELSKLLSDGFTVVIANDFTKNGNTEYIEYIVEKTEGSFRNFDHEKPTD